MVISSTLSLQAFKTLVKKTRSSSLIYFAEFSAITTVINFKLFPRYFRSLSAFSAGLAGLYWNVTSVFNETDEISFSISTREFLNNSAIINKGKCAFLSSIKREFY